MLWPFLRYVHFRARAHLRARMTVGVSLDRLWSRGFSHWFAWVEEAREGQASEREMDGEEELVRARKAAGARARGYYSRE